MESDGCKLARGRGAHGSGGGHARQGSGIESHDDRPLAGTGQGKGSIRRSAEAPDRRTGSSTFLTVTSSRPPDPTPPRIQTHSLCTSDCFVPWVCKPCLCSLLWPWLWGRQACVEIPSLASNEGRAGAWEKAEDRGQLCNLIIRLQKGDLIYSCSSLLS